MTQMGHRRLRCEWQMARAVGRHSIWSMIIPSVLLSFSWSLFALTQDLTCSAIQESLAIMANHKKKKTDEKKKCCWRMKRNFWVHKLVEDDDQQEEGEAGGRRWQRFCCFVDKQKLRGQMEAWPAKRCPGYHTMECVSSRLRIALIQ